MGVMGVIGLDRLFTKLPKFTNLPNFPNLSNLPKFPNLPMRHNNTKERLDRRSLLYCKAIYYASPCLLKP